MANGTEVREAIATLDLINEAYNDWVEGGSRRIDASASLETVGHVLIDYFGAEPEYSETEDKDED